MARYMYAYAMRAPDVEPGCFGKKGGANLLVNWQGMDSQGNPKKWDKLGTQTCPKQAWAASGTELLLESLPEKLRFWAAEVLRHSPDSSVPWAIPWHLNRLCCIWAAVKPCKFLDPLDALMTLLSLILLHFKWHLHAKAILQEALRNWWWFLYPQPVHPVTLAILPFISASQGGEEGCPMQAAVQT